MAPPLHDGLGARELDVGIKSFGEEKVGTADQQETKLGLAQFLVKLGVPTPVDIDLERVRRLIEDAVVESVAASVSAERRCHDLPKILFSLRLPELLAIATVEIAQRLSDQSMRSLRPNSSSSALTIGTRTRA